MSFDVTELGVAETLRASTELRAAADGRDSVESLAQRVCTFFYDELSGPGGPRACALVRFYATHPYGELQPADQEFAAKLLPERTAPWPELRCLTLLGTRGDVPAWNDRTASRGHRSIPLPSTRGVEEAPMIAQLFRQMGADIADVVQPSPQLLADPGKRSYNVFHVLHAKGSPHIPAQREFVEPHGIESVVGFGGALPWGEHFAVILFARTTISARAAGRFRTLALDVRSKLLGFSLEQVFRSQVDDTTEATTDAEQEVIEDRRAEARGQTRTRTSGTILREFTDTKGVHWKVWAIVPTSAELDSLDGTRRKKSQLRQGTWREGWLLFESESDARRLRPIPENWATAQEIELERFCRDARPSTRTRLA
jgi:hypothetical protein